MNEQQQPKKNDEKFFSCVWNGVESGGAISADVLLDAWASAKLMCKWNKQCSEREVEKKYVYVVIKILNNFH